VVLTNEIVARSNYFLVATNMQNSIHDVRLTFRWPRLPTQAIGNGRQSFRTSAGGRLTRVVDPGFNPNAPEYWLHFFAPRDYARNHEALFRIPIFSAGGGGGPVRCGKLW
jgi:hypothetical protein